VVLAAGYSWFAARSTPFTAGADVTTAVPLVVAVSSAVLFTLPAGISTDPPRSVPWPRMANTWNWWVAFGALVAWELSSYWQLPRRQHPTISSLYDSATRWPPVKAVLFFGWLLLGWSIVASYRRERR
jgi:hypothetical protein